MNYKQPDRKTQKDMIDEYCWHNTYKNDALEQLEHLSQKSNATKEELMAFKRDHNKDIKPFVEEINKIFKPFNIDVDIQRLNKFDLLIEPMIPTPFHIHIDFSYNFTETLEQNLNNFMDEFKSYYQFFKETSNILSNIQDTFIYNRPF